MNYFSNLMMAVNLMELLSSQLVYIMISLNLDCLTQKLPSLDSSIFLPNSQFIKKKVGQIAASGRQHRFPLSNWLSVMWVWSLQSKIFEYVNAVANHSSDFRNHHHLPKLNWFSITYCSEQYRVSQSKSVHA